MDIEIEGGGYDFARVVRVCSRTCVCKQRQVRGGAVRAYEREGESVRASEREKERETQRERQRETERGKEAESVAAGSWRRRQAPERRSMKTGRRTKERSRLLQVPVCVCER